MRVLLVVGRMERGGIQTWLLHLLRSEGRQFEADLLVHTAVPCDYDHEVRALGVRILPCVHPRKNPVGYTSELGRILRSEGPYDAIHCHFAPLIGWILMVAHWAGVPVRVAHSHNDYNRLYAQSSSAQRLWMALMRRLVNRHATLGLAASREAAASLFGANWQRDPRWKVLHCGIDTTPFRAATPGRAELREQLGIPHDAFVVAHVGRFARQKNHRFLIDIAQVLAKREPRFRLLLLGDGELRDDILRRTQVAGLADKVVFAGNRPDIPQLMQHAIDVLVLPSLSEGLPLVGIEAQAAGLVTVLSDVITTELDHLPGLVRRLSLQQTASQWADEILDAGNAPPPLHPNDALRAIEDSPFSIRVSVHELERAYELARTH